MSLNDVRDFRWILVIGKLMANKVAISTTRSSFSELRSLSHIWPVCRTRLLTVHQMFFAMFVSLYSCISKILAVKMLPSWGKGLKLYFHITDVFFFGFFLAEKVNTPLPGYHHINSTFHSRAGTYALSWFFFCERSVPHIVS